MKGVKYEFIAFNDFSTSFPFEISTNKIDFPTPQQPLILNNIDNSFILIIPENTKIDENFFYLDALNNDISGNLQILVDSSNINYFYDSIAIKINKDLSDIEISIKNYNDSNNNKNLFLYEENCKYIIEGNDEKQNLLSNENKECLTSVSKADFSNNKYIFNKKTHNSLIENNLNNNLDENELKYGLYDGSYIIFNIESSYPITLDNIEISNNVYINENYLYTKLYDKNSEIVSNLNITNNIHRYKNYNYYYGAINIIVSNNVNNNINDISFLILDKENNSIIEISNTLFYTELCENNTDNFNDYRNVDKVTFKLYNEKNILFDNIDNFNEENVYNLNIFNTYKEIKKDGIIKEYIATDKFNHDLTHLIDVSLISTSVNNYTENITNIINITNNYEIDEFFISYNLKYFDLTDILINRIVKINYGPFIEISNNEDIFINKNSLTKQIDISTNENVDNSLIFRNIEAYIYDKSSNKINLPFVEYSGFL